MAILSKIRDRSLFLILIIGLALFAFVASPKDIMNFFSSKKANSVGKINGEDITIEEFNGKVETYKEKFGNAKEDQVTKAVWEEMVAQKIFDEQLEKASVVVGEKDVWNAIISDPSINSSETFKNESGLFDEELLKSFIAEMKQDDTKPGKEKWASWVSYDNDMKKNVRRQAYFQAVSAGMGYTIEEAKAYYNQNNTRVSGKYVLLPYSNIADSIVSVSDKDIKQYVNKHQSRFKTYAKRDVRFVSFPIRPSAEDKDAVKSAITKLLDDHEEYDSKTKKNIKVAGFKTTENVSAFITEYSDLPEDTEYIYEGEQKLPVDSLFQRNIGYVFGPYQEGDYFKITRLTEKKDVPEAKASHILITFKEGETNPNAKLTKEEAKAKAESILAKIKSGADFTSEAKVNSEDPGSGSRGGDLGWFKEGRMVPKFNDWVFSHKKGDLGLVESQFGYHIIKIDDTRSKLGIKLGTVARLIEPSDKTLNDIFVLAASFESAVQKKPKDFEKIAKEKNVLVRTAKNLSRGQSNIPGIDSPAASITYWAFNDNTEKGDYKRVDLEKSYVIAQLVEVQEEGIMSIESAKSIVTPILAKDLKAELLEKKLAKGNLSEIATKEDVTVQEVKESTLLDAPPALSYDKSVLAAMSQMKDGTVLRNIVGKNGVYMVQLDNKVEPAALSSYESILDKMQKDIRVNGMSIYNALKEASDVGELKL